MVDVAGVQGVVEEEEGVVVEEAEMEEAAVEGEAPVVVAEEGAVEAAVGAEVEKVVASVSIQSVWYQATESQSPIDASPARSSLSPWRGAT